MQIFEKCRRVRVCLHDRFSDSLVAAIDETALEKVMDLDVQRMTRCVAGRYYKVGMLEGSPIYRQDWSVES